MTSRFATASDPRRSSGAWLGRASAVSSRALFAGTLFVCALLAKSAEAEPLELRWEAPPECPNVQTVRERIRELAATSPDKLTLRAEGRIERVDARYRLVLTLRDGSDVRQRTIESASCDDLAGAAAVSLGLLLRAVEEQRKDGGSAGSASGSVDGTQQGAGEQGGTASDGSKPKDSAGADPTSSPASDGSQSGATAKPEPTKDAVPPEDPAANDAPKRHWAVLFRAPLAVVNWGPLPKPSLGVGVGLGLRYYEWHLLLTGRTHWPQTVWSSLSPNTGARVERAALEFSACRQWRAGMFAWAPCAALAVERVTASGLGVGVEQAMSSSLLPVLAAQTSGYLYFTDWMALTGTASLAASNSRPRIVIDDLGEVRQLGALRGGLGLGLEWIF